MFPLKIQSLFFSASRTWLWRATWTTWCAWKPSFPRHASSRTWCQCYMDPHALLINVDLDSYPKGIWMISLKSLFQISFFKKNYAFQEIYPKIIKIIKILQERFCTIQNADIKFIYFNFHEFIITYKIIARLKNGF